MLKKLLSLCLLMLISVNINYVSDYAKQQYNVDNNILHDYCYITQQYIKQYGKYLHTPIEYTLTSDLIDANSITIEDRYNHFPETAELHLDYIFYGRRRSWAMNRIKKHV